MTSPSDLRHESVEPQRAFSADAGVDSTADRPPTRVVLLGASNLTLSFPTVISRLHSGLDGPLHVYSAHGHGRSFGSWSRVVVRGLPGIVGCRLWHDLETPASHVKPAMPARASGRRSRSPLHKRTPLPACEGSRGSRDAMTGRQARTLGLLTDVGNDLLYAATVPQISGWVETCLERLRSYDADVTLTLLPMQSVERLSAWRYHMTKAIFFPGSHLGWNEMLGRARALNDRLGELARQYGARVVEQPGEWYGFDPIHIRHTRRDFAWQRILSEWPGFNAAEPPARMSATAHCRLWLHAPAERRLLGIHRTKQQPTGRFEQIAVHLY